MFNMFVFLLAMFSAGAVFSQTHPANVAAINPADMIRVTDATSADAMRAGLIDDIYSGDGLSSPGVVTFHSTFNPIGTSWQGNTNLASIQEWRVTVSRGFQSRLYRFMPTVYRNPTSGKGAVIVSAGHGHIGTTPPYQASIQWFVASGYEVWTVDMPVSGLNAAQTIIDPTVGRLAISNHDQMQVMRTPTFNPLRIFMEPVTAIVDDLHSRGITNIGMFGLSGGGWTTTLYAALDTRILASYSIAGTMPIYARSWSPPHNALGDWEQREIPALGVDYTDLYILAAQNRRFVNIHNLGDDCCFGGTVANHYHAAVNSVVTAVGGSYATVIDNTATSHTITSWAGNWFRLDMASRF